MVLPASQVLGSSTVTELHPQAWKMEICDLRNSAFPVECGPGRKKGKVTFSVKKKTEVCTAVSVLFQYVNTHSSKI